MLKLIANFHCQIQAPNLAMSISKIHWQIDPQAENQTKQKYTVNRENKIAKPHWHALPDALYIAKLHCQIDVTSGQPNGNTEMHLDLWKPHCQISCCALPKSQWQFSLPNCIVKSTHMRKTTWNDRKAFWIMNTALPKPIVKTHRQMSSPICIIISHWQCALIWIHWTAQLGNQNETTENEPWTTKIALPKPIAKSR